VQPSDEHQNAPGRNQRTVRYDRRQRAQALGSNPDMLSPADLDADGNPLPGRVDRLGKCGRCISGPGSHMDPNFGSIECVGVYRIVEDGRARAFTKGAISCGSVWACPVCSARIREARTLDVQAALAAHWSTASPEGTSAALLTLTLRHGADDPLKDLLDVTLTGWSKLVAGRFWQQLSSDFGIRGYIRACEVTLNRANGWHPHLHAILLFDRPLDPHEVEALHARIAARWAAIVKTKLGRTLNEHGCDLRPIRFGDLSGAGYVTKVQDSSDKDSPGEWSAARELLRFDLKEGRAESGTPFQLLDCLDDPWAVRKWREYETATKGRRALTWSHGLRASLRLDAEQSDEQLALFEEEVEEVEGEESGVAEDGIAELVCIVTPGQWEIIRRRRFGITTLLDMAEDEGPDGCRRLLDAWFPERRQSSPFRS